MEAADLTAERRGLRFTMHQIDDGRAQFIVERVSDGNILTSTLCSPEARDRFEEIIEAWIDDRLGVNPPKPVYCSACNSVLVPGLRSDTEYQFDNALWIKFSGGYGMFIDPFEGDPQGVLCHECAHALCGSQPWIANLLNPHDSHAHRTEDIPRLLAEGHTGWDLHEREDH